MVVRLRLQRFGRTHAPFYRIVAADARAPRDGRFIEIIGTYNPRPDEAGRKHVSLNLDRAKYWLAVGAQPSDRVGRLLAKGGVMPYVPKPFLAVKTPTPLPPSVTAVEAAAAAAKKAPIPGSAA